MKIRGPLASTKEHQKFPLVAQLFIHLLQQDISLTFQHISVITFFLDLPPTAGTGAHDRVGAEPLHTLLSQDIPPSIPGTVQAVDTGFTVRLQAPWALTAGFEFVLSIS